MNMKQILTFFIAAMVLLAPACKKETTLNPAPSKIEGLAASWVLVQASQVDELSLIKETADITDFYATGAAMPNITFNSNFTFTSDNTGVAKTHFGNSGTWAFDNNDYPTKIILTYTGGGTDDLPLGATIRTTDKRLKIKQTINCGTDAVFSYLLEFERK